MGKFRLFFSAVAVSAVLTGCGGGGGGGTVTPALPSDAVTITTSNADGIATSAVATFDMVYAFSGVDSVTLPPMRATIERITDSAFNRDKQPSNIVSGITDTAPCSVSGSYTDTYTFDANGYSGSYSFSNCNDGYGITFNGSFSYSSSWNISTGDYSDTANGSLTMSYGSYSFTMAFNFTETGNDNTGDFSITMSYSLSGVPGAGFLVTTETPLTGTWYYPDSGSLLIQGSNNTRLRILLINSSQAEVYVDEGSGTFTYHSTIYI